MTENKCGYQMHIFVTSFSTQHAPLWRCFCVVQPLRQPFRPKCTTRILQMHHQNPVVPPESGVHRQNPVCTYSVKEKMWIYSLRSTLPHKASISTGVTKHPTLRIIYSVKSEMKLRIHFQTSMVDPLAVCECLSNFIQYSTKDVIIYPCRIKVNPY